MAAGGGQGADEEEAATALGERVGGFERDGGAQVARGSRVAVQHLHLAVARQQLHIQLDRAVSLGVLDSVGDQLGGQQFGGVPVGPGQRLADEGAGERDGLRAVRQRAVP
ncbi:hypothetical protein GA0115257_10302 [Streptomyces sp. LcepLS]|nr:hypothetical protein GA0115257_10302 [Streptomyces sp. LcepLS]